MPPGRGKATYVLHEGGGRQPRITRHNGVICAQRPHQSNVTALGVARRAVASRAGRSRRRRGGRGRAGCRARDRGGRGETAGANTQNSHTLMARSSARTRRTAASAKQQRPPGALQTSRSPALFFTRSTRRLAFPASSATGMEPAPPWASSIARAGVDVFVGTWCLPAPLPPPQKSPGITDWAQPLNLKGGACGRSGRCP